MARCRLCNWTAHDESAHVGPHCSHGHPLEVVGQYAYAGRSPHCRACALASQRRYYWRNRERELARSRAWRLAHV